MIKPKMKTLEEVATVWSDLAKQFGCFGEILKVATVWSDLAKIAALVKF